MQETNQPHLERDQTNNLENLNPCPRCAGRGELVSNLNKNEHSIVCPCGYKVTFYTSTLDKWPLFFLESLWNMPLVETEISQKVIDALVIADQDFLVFDLRNYSLIKVFHTLLDATKFMENRFDEDMEQRTILF